MLLADGEILLLNNSREMRKRSRGKVHARGEHLFAPRVKKTKLSSSEASDTRRGKNFLVQEYTRRRGDWLISREAERLLERADRKLNRVGERGVFFERGLPPYQSTQLFL